MGRGLGLMPSPNSRSLPRVNLPVGMGTFLSDLKYADTNGDGVIDLKDRTYHGSY